MKRRYFLTLIISLAIVVLPIGGLLNKSADAVGVSSSVLSFQLELKDKCTQVTPQAPPKRCIHGRCGKHWYDAATGVCDDAAVTITSETQGTSFTESPKPSSTAPTITLYSIAVENNTGLALNLSVNGMTKTVNGITTVFAKSEQYINLSISYTQHCPIIATLNSGLSNATSKLVDGLQTTLSVKAGTKVILSMGATSGIVSLPKVEGAATATHDATKCSIGTTTVDVHHRPSGSGAGGPIYDSAGNVIGSWGSSTVCCSVCNLVLSSSTNINVDSDYNGSFSAGGNTYIQSGGKLYSVDAVGVTPVTNGTYNSATNTTSYSLGGVKASYSGATLTDSSHPCITRTYTYCSEHQYYGEHYYCSQHGYVGTSSTCVYCTSGGSPYPPSYGNTMSPQIEVFPINLSLPDGTCAGYADYMSAIEGTIVTVTITNKPALCRYTISTASTIIKSESISGTSFSFTMPAAAVTITLEQGKKNQRITVSSSFTKTYNQPPFALNASAGAA